jgi:citrate lyase beta subunit
MANSTLITNATAYAVYATKAAFMTDLEDAIEQADKAKQREVIYKLSNTDTDNWTGDSTARHDA